MQLKEGNPASTYGPALKPFIMYLPQDLKSFWYCLGKGGAAKVIEEFCHLYVHVNHPTVYALQM